MRPWFPLVFALAALGPPPRFPRENIEILERILQAEDHRASGPGELDFLFTTLAGPDPALAAAAARAVGRLERPRVAAPLIPLVSEGNPLLRAAAAEALAQAAQGFRRDSSSMREGWSALLQTLRAQLARESDPAVRGMLALSLGRLPYLDVKEITEVRGELIGGCAGGDSIAPARVGFCRGAEMLVRGSARRVPLSPGERAALRRVAGDPALPVASRRPALGALLLSSGEEDAIPDAAFDDADPELRRLALSGLRRSGDSAQPNPLLDRALADPVPAVRLEAIRALARLQGSQGCGRLAVASGDPAPMVALVALDLLGPCGQDSGAVRALQGATRLSDSAHWHRPAHALLALAQAAPARARAPLRELAAQSGWQLRMYAARAAAVLGDTTLLLQLAAEPVANVREAAVQGLARSRGHRADAVYRRELRSADYQLVLTAAGALAGTTERAATAAACLEALDRISLQRAETSRDTRIGLLVRLRETGGASLAPRLKPYLADFDPLIADSAAALLTAWGSPATASPQPRPPAPVTLAEVEALRGMALVFSMVSGARFTVELLVDQAPLTVARIARLVRARYYDGLDFHRWAANFVIQGGSPGANEYAGAPAFMRDEVGAQSHARGTLGVSTRGRDTGDGQLFINLRDNPRLDYEYTVWGRVLTGLAAVDAILEGDGIRRVEIRPR